MHKQIEIVDCLFFSSFLTTIVCYTLLFLVYKHFFLKCQNDIITKPILYGEKQKKEAKYKVIVHQDVF